MEESGDIRSRSAGVVIGRVVGGLLFFRARTALEQIARAAHACGDPGLINLDAVNRGNPTHPRHQTGEAAPVPGVGVIRTTTPCGEQPLLPYEKCFLGSFNVAAYVADGAFDHKRLKEDVGLAVRLMDDVIELELGRGHSPSAAVTWANRKIGLGIMGLADALAELDLPYDSEETRATAGTIAATIQAAANQTSRELAAERGPFGNWPHSSFARNGQPTRRPATVTTIAPTGYISTLAGCSTGIEPYFLLEYVRDAAGLSLQGCAPLQRKLEEVGYSLAAWVAATQQQSASYRFDGTLAGLAETPTEDERLNAPLQRLKPVFRTAGEVAPSDHLKMVQALQRYVENGISKTINLPAGASVADVSRILEEAMLRGLKGITVFRDGCLKHQALFTVPACPTCGETKAMRVNGISLGIASSDQVLDLEDLILTLMLDLESAVIRNASGTGRPCVILCDRGAMDVSAYMPETLWQQLLHRHGWTVFDLCEDRYDGVIHLVTAADGAESFCHTEDNPARTESANEARALDRRLRIAWERHPRYELIDNSTDFADKLSRVLVAVLRILKGTNEPRPRTRSHVAGPSLAGTKPKRLPYL